MPNFIRNKLLEEPEIGFHFANFGNCILERRLEITSHSLGRIMVQGSETNVRVFGMAADFTPDKDRVIGVMDRSVRLAVKAFQTRQLFNVNMVVTVSSTARFARSFEVENVGPFASMVDVFTAGSPIQWTRLVAGLTPAHTGLPSISER